MYICWQYLLNQCSDYSLCFLQGSISMQQLKFVNCILFSVPLIYGHMRQVKVSHQIFDLLYFLRITASFASYTFQFCISTQLQRFEFFLSFCSLFSLTWKNIFAVMWILTYILFLIYLFTSHYIQFFTIYPHVFCCTLIKRPCIDF